MTAGEIRSALAQARVPGAAKMNVADVLAKSGHLVDTDGSRGAALLWKLTAAGEQFVRGLKGLPAADAEVEHDVADLEAMASKIKDADVREYVTEAITCLRAGARRACVVFLWAGAIRTIQDRMMAFGASAVDAAIRKHDKGARAFGKFDDFAYVKDDTALVAAEGLGLLDKNERGTLAEALGLRNKAGHPGKYQPGVKKVSSFIEDIRTIVFP